MTTSGTYTFNLTKTQIITRAFNILNIYDLKATVEADDYSFASDILNSMLKMWETEGIKLWKRRQATLFPVLNQNNYQLGSVSGADRCTNTYYSTTLTTTVSSGTTIVVNSATNLITGMYIGIELDNGSRQWTTITNIASTTLTLNDAITSSATSGNTIVAYSALINRPLKLLRATTYDLNTSTDTMVQLLSYDDYFNLPLKTTSGRPVNAYYDRLINNTLPYTGTLYLFNQPSDVDIIFKFTYLDALQDMLNSTDTLDMPQEWLYPIIINLAAELCIPYGKLTELQAIQGKADTYKLALENFDSDDSSLIIGTDNLHGNY